MLAHTQDQSIFFQLPLELRQEVYQSCQLFYMGHNKRLAHKSSTNLTGMLPCGPKPGPALLQSCKRIREEAEQWMKHHIHIQYCTTASYERLDIRTVGIAQLRWVRKLTLESDGLGHRPNMMFRLTEHIIDHSPRLQILEIRWRKLVYSQICHGVISFENVIKPWLPIVSKAKSLKILRLDGAQQKWATAFRNELERQNPGVKLDVKLYRLIRYRENGA